MTGVDNCNEAKNFVEFRRKVRAAEVLSGVHAKPVETAAVQRTSQRGFAKWPGVEVGI